jgi:hypothetical protein
VRGQEDKVRWQKLEARRQSADREVRRQKPTAKSQNADTNRRTAKAKNAKGDVIPTGAKRSGGISQGIRRLHRFGLKVPNPSAPWGEGAGWVCD